jgi:hypothetical protein
VNKEEYPTHYIPINFLFYKILHERYADEPVQEYMDWVARMEKILPIIGADKTYFPDSSREANILGVYRSIVIEGLWYPLIVKKEYEHVYYVVVGNQRLCALRAMKCQGRLPCIIAKEEDSWDDDNEAATHIKLEALKRRLNER